MVQKPNALLSRVQRGHMTELHGSAHRKLATTGWLILVQVIAVSHGQKECPRALEFHTRRFLYEVASVQTEGVLATLQVDICIL